MRIKLFFLSTRPQFLPAIIVPVTLGASAAWHTTGRFNLLFFLISVAAAVFYHAGMNVINDYYDYRNGTDNINKKGLTPFTGGSRFIQKGLITPKETLAFGLGLITLGTIAGLFLSYFSPWLLAIGAVGLFSGYFYSAPPIFLAGRGLGELTVGVNFGLLTVLGSYLLQAGSIGTDAVFLSIPISFLIAALLFINEFPDFEADRQANKRNLVVRLGPKKARGLIFLFIAGAYLGIIAGVMTGFLHALTLIVMLSLIPALLSAKGLIKNYEGGQSLIPSIKSIILAHLSSGILLVISNLF
ncbi:MAG: 1,4-dihydroxy-2-naphthoate octaprenyltransferase [Deltaproteobacteria bacterium]|nr:1,4-dihydroxy-2-naphthoate octaprenyltransferase [Deltaproteobacteria bacterium]